MILLIVKETLCTCKNAKNIQNTYFIAFQAWKVALLQVTKYYWYIIKGNIYTIFCIFAAKNGPIAQLDRATDF